MYVILRYFFPLITLFVYCSLLPVCVSVVSDNPVFVIIILDNGTEMSHFVYPKNPFFVDAFPAGIEKIQWIGFDGNMYEKKLNFSLFDNWYVLKLSGKRIVVQRYHEQNPENIVLQEYGVLVQRCTRAGLKARSSLAVELTVFFDNGTTKTGKIDPHQKKTYKVDGVFAGITKIQWKRTHDDTLYEVMLNIKWNEGWFSILVNGKSVFIYDEDGYIARIIPGQIVSS